MTDLERAQQQGNQAAPDLLNAAINGELGGGGGENYVNPSNVDFIATERIESIQEIWPDNPEPSDDLLEDYAQRLYDTQKKVLGRIDFFGLNFNDEQDSTIASFYYFSDKLKNEAISVLNELKKYPDNFFNLSIEAIDALIDLLDSIETNVIFETEGAEVIPGFLDLLVFLGIDKIYKIGILDYKLEDNWFYYVFGGLLVSEDIKVCILPYKSETPISEPVKFSDHYLYSGQPE